MDIENKVTVCLEDNGVTIAENGDFVGLDSISFISAIVSLEDEFSFEFPDEYLLIGAMPNFNSMVEIIKSSLKNSISEN